MRTAARRAPAICRRASAVQKTIARHIWRSWMRYLASGEDLDLSAEVAAGEQDGRRNDGGRCPCPAAEAADGLYTSMSGIRSAVSPSRGEPVRPERSPCRRCPEAELRLAPDETAYIINLTGAEAREGHGYHAGQRACLSLRPRSAVSVRASVRSVFVIRRRCCVPA